MDRRFGLSVIIVTYKPEESLLNTIESILNHVKVPLEILLSDNSLETNSLFDVACALSPSVSVIYNKHNGGFSYGNNEAFKSAGFSHILFINPDAVLLSDILAEHLHLSDGMGIISGKCIDADGAEKHIAGHFPTSYRYALSFARMIDGDAIERNPLPGSALIPVDWVEGSLLLLTSELFEKVGGFCEDIFLYGEDYELCYRVKQYGLGSFILPSLLFQHVGGYSPKREPCIVEGMIFFAERHLGSRIAAQVRLALLAKFSVLLPVLIVRSPFDKYARSRVEPAFRSLTQSLKKAGRGKT